MKDIKTMPTPLKRLGMVFLFVLSVGYFTGLGFVRNTTSLTPLGVVENYTGNEEDEEAEVMKFKKSDREMLTIIHTHILSLSVIFFLLAVMVYFTSAPQVLKSFLMIEPMISVLVTFGGIYFIWLGMYWATYLVMFSGMLMTLSYLLSCFLIFRDLIHKA